MIFDKIVIGAGFAGLLHGLTAARSGQQVLILEKGKTPGGLIQQAQIAGISFDSGAEAFSTATPEFVDWLGQLGLADSIVRPSAKSPVLVTRSGTNTIPKGVFGVPTSLDDPDLEFLGAEAIALAKKLDERPLPENLDQLSVKELVDLRLGSTFTESLVGPVISGVHGSAPRDLEAASVLAGLVKAMKETGSIVTASKLLRGDKPAPGSAVASFEGGMHRLIQNLVRLFEEAGGTLRLNQGVEKVTRLDDGLFEIDAGELLQSAELVVATSAKAAAKILQSHRELSDSLGEIASLETLLINVLVESKALNSYPVGTGALVAEGLGMDVKATTHVNAKWLWVNAALPENQHLIRFSFREPNEPKNLDAALQAGFSKIYGLENPKILGQLAVRWEDSLVRATPGHLERIQHIRNLAQGLGIELRGSCLAGNGLLGILKHELAIREGDLVGNPK